MHAPRMAGVKNNAKKEKDNGCGGGRGGAGGINDYSALSYPPPPAAAPLLPLLLLQHDAECCAAPHARVPQSGVPKKVVHCGLPRRAAALLAAAPATDSCLLRHFYPSRRQAPHARSFGVNIHHLCWRLSVPRVSSIIDDRLATDPKDRAAATQPPDANTPTSGPRRGAGLIRLASPAAARLQAQSSSHLFDNDRAPAAFACVAFRSQESAAEVARTEVSLQLSFSLFPEQSQGAPVNTQNLRNERQTKPPGLL